MAASRRSAPASLKHWENSLQFRIDLVDPSAPIDSVADEDVIVGVFRTEVSDPATLEADRGERRPDRAGWPDGASAPRQGTTVAALRAGVDDIRFEPLAAGAGIELPHLQAAPKPREACRTAPGTTPSPSLSGSSKPGAHETGTARSLLADFVATPLMADNEMAANTRCVVAAP